MRERHSTDHGGFEQSKRHQDRLEAVRAEPPYARLWAASACMTIYCGAFVAQQDANLMQQETAMRRGRAVLIALPPLSDAEMATVIGAYLKSKTRRDLIEQRLRDQARP